MQYFEETSSGKSYAYADGFPTTLQYTNKANKANDLLKRALRTKEWFENCLDLFKKGGDLDAEDACDEYLRDIQTKDGKTIWNFDDVPGVRKLTEFLSDFNAKTLTLSDEERAGIVKLLCSQFSLTEAKDLPDKMKTDYFQAVTVPAENYIKRCIRKAVEDVFADHPQFKAFRDPKTDDDYCRLLLALYLKSQDDWCKSSQNKILYAIAAKCSEQELHLTKPDVKAVIDACLSGKIRYEKIKKLNYGSYKPDPLFKIIDACVQGAASRAALVDTIRNGKDEPTFRENFFELGFALRMDAYSFEQEVLFKAFGVCGIDWKDINETIQAVCMDLHLRYSKAQGLKEKAKDVEEAVRKSEPDAPDQGQIVAIGNTQMYKDALIDMGVIDITEAGIDDFAERLAKQKAKIPADTSAPENTYVAVFRELLRPIVSDDSQIQSGKREKLIRTIYPDIPSSAFPFKKINQRTFANPASLSRDELAVLIFFLYSEEGLPRYILRQARQENAIEIRAEKPWESEIFHIRETINRITERELQLPEWFFTDFTKIAKEHSSVMNWHGFLNDTLQSCMAFVSFPGTYTEQGCFADRAYYQQHKETISTCLEVLDKAIKNTQKTIEKKQRLTPANDLYNDLLELNANYLASPIRGAMSPLLGVKAAENFADVMNAVMSACRFRPVSFNDPLDVLLFYCVLKAYTDTDPDSDTPYQYTPLEIFRQEIQNRTPSP